MISTGPRNFSDSSNWALRSASRSRTSSRAYIFLSTLWPISADSSMGRPSRRLLPELFGVDEAPRRAREVALDFRRAGAEVLMQRDGCRVVAGDPEIGGEPCRRGDVVAAAEHFLQQFERGDVPPRPAAREQRCEELGGVALLLRRDPQRMARGGVGARRLVN